MIQKVLGALKSEAVSVPDKLSDSEVCVVTRQNTRSCSARQGTMHRSFEC